MKENNDLMALKLVCKCGKEFIAFQKRAGETIICKKCGATVVMPDINNLEDVTFKDVTGQVKIQLKEAGSNAKTEKYTSGASSFPRNSTPEPSGSSRKEADAPAVSAHEPEESSQEIEAPPSAYKNKKRRIKPVVSMSSFKAILKILLFFLLVGLLIYFAPAILKLITAFLKNVKY